MGAEQTQQQSSGGEQQVLTPGLVTQIFDRVRQIKLKHPELSRRIDGEEARIREHLMCIRDAVDEFPERERELITVLVINGVHKMCDEILIDPESELSSADE